MLIYLLLCTLLEAYKILEMEIHPICKPLEALAPLCKAVLVKSRPGLLFFLNLSCSQNVCCLFPHLLYSLLSRSSDRQVQKQFLFCLSQRGTFERGAERSLLSCLLTPSQDSTHENKCILTGLQQQHLFEVPVFLTIEFQDDNKTATSRIHH